MKKYASKPFGKTLYSPSALILFSSSAILSLLLISGIIVTLLPENLLHPVLAFDCAVEILSASSRVIALGAVFLTATAILEKRYPEVRK